MVTPYHGGMNISRHFTLAELTRSQTALRRGINNQPTPAALLALHDLAVHILQPLRARFGPYSPTSCFRSPMLNAAIGSGPNSQHVLGEAADVKIATISNLTLVEWIATNLPFDQLILEFTTHDDPHSGWVHVSYSRSQQRGAVLRADRHQGVTRYAPLHR